MGGSQGESHGVSATTANCPFSATPQTRGSRDEEHDARSRTLASTGMEFPSFVRHLCLR
jgi:hypothetical protein